VHFDATEYGDKIIFMHAVQDGPANRSFGIQVAQLAGVPASVIQRAKQKLRSFELEKATQLPFEGEIRQPEATVSHPALEMLGGVNPDQLSPREALELLYRLKAAT
jgi:DNA mismatch repair protein MutS